MPIGYAQPGEVAIGGRKYRQSGGRYEEWAPSGGSWMWKPVTNRSTIQQIESLMSTPYGGVGGTSGGGAGTLTGAASRGYDPAYGGVPAASDPVAAYLKAIQGNLANLPAILDAAKKINEFNLGQVTGQYEAGVPNYQNLVGQSSQNIQAALAGEVPADVKTAIQQAAAERGIAYGIPGSQAADYDYLRSLGITSLGQQQYGEQALTGAVNRMPRAALYDVTQMLVPGAEQQAAQQAANIYASAPVPAAAAAADLAASQAGMNLGARSASVPTPYYGNIGAYTPRATPTAGASSGGYRAPAYVPPAVQSTTPGWAMSTGAGGTVTYGNVPSYAYNPTPAVTTTTPQLTPDEEYFMDQLYNYGPPVPATNEDLWDEYFDEYGW